MYHFLQTKSLSEQIEFMTKQLVQIPSVTGTEGESKKADQIKQWIASFPYFQRHPEHLWEQVIPDSKYRKKNIFAFVKGGLSAPATMIYHSHFDTVGVKDFGSIEDKAFNPDALMAYFKEYEADPEVKAEAQSGDWMFGRGALDMQSGDAVHLANLLYFSEHHDEMQGNLLVMFNPDEESEHKGVIAAISELKRLQIEEGLEFIAAINSDFVSPLFENDKTHYLYTGAAGKLLPSFYIYGRESHVGETLKGIDSTLIASKINWQINNNMDLIEDIEGEVVNPPSCLYQRDEKDIYNVQTPFKTYMYFNYFLYEESLAGVINKLKRLTIDACTAVEEKLKENYDRYAKKTGQITSQLSWHIEVNTLQEYISLLKDRGIDVDHVIRQTVQDHKGMELRELSFKIVDALQQKDSEKKPRVILFYSPPYLPNNYLRDHKLRDHMILNAMKQVVEESGEQDSFAIKRFFPFLSDSSYLSLHETNEGLEALIENFSLWNECYSIPVKDIRSLSIPAINMGVYGKDAHKWTERVYKPYSFNTLPMLIRRLTEILLTQDTSVRKSKEYFEYKK
ncbi:M20/M25/M40 family metallo-hydrolase [Scopulibacillus cellulosilyticus]|uniref:M20/M25/M40 family metallo-hydrolase n=1 Tax=Scopulibacillus cellulosilyticus TaxID=2665665 RepID=A0ABW2Q1Y3_9BACL